MLTGRTLAQHVQSLASNCSFLTKTSRLVSRHKCVWHDSHVYNTAGNMAEAVRLQG